MRALIRFIILAVFVVLLAACNSRGDLPTHQFVQEDIKKPDNKMHSWKFLDMNDDGVHEVLQVSTDAPGYNFMIIYDSRLKALSQINMKHKIRGFELLRHPETKHPWLFYSFNDGSKVYLQVARYEWTEPLRRTDLAYEPIERFDELKDNPNYEWFAAIYPQKIVDLDGDGRLDLICMTSDSFTSNPRGVVVYDLESGAKKWQFNVPTAPASLLCEDFDGNGNYEVLLSNYSFKNNNWEMHGIDDSNGWLMMLDSAGNLLASQKTFNDFGAIKLAIADTDDDGIPEIYKLEATWGASNYQNRIEKLLWKEGRFQNIAKYISPTVFSRYHDSFVVSENPADKTKFVVPVKGSKLLILDRDLEPLEHRFEIPVQIVWAIDDILGKSHSQILVQSDDGNYHLLNHEGRLLASIANPFPDESGVHANIVSINGNLKRVVFSTPMQMRYYRIGRLPLHTLFVSYVKHYSKLVNTLILLLLLGVFIRMFRIRNCYRRIINGMQSGVVLYNYRGKAIYINRYMKSFYNDLQINKESDISEVTNQIYAHLQRFKKTNSYADETVMDINFGSSIRSFRLAVMKPGGFFLRYAVLLNPVLITQEELDTKLAWADLARRLSHHVRRHISNVLLAMEPLDAEGTSAEARKEYMDLIRDEVNQIKIFTHSFQRFTELKDYQLKYQDILPSIERTLARIKPQENIKLVKDYSLKSVEAWIEPIRFEEALANIIGNALDAMSKGGTLNISVKEFPFHEINDKNLNILIEIEDTGSGISPKYLEEIWQPFFTTKQSGTGIGLPESKKIIESMNGEVRIQSEQGIGTIVSIWLQGEQR